VARAQGHVVWADLPEPVGRRPALILTRTDALRRLSNVTVAPLTRTIRGINAEVFLSEEDGLPSECAVSLDNILTIPADSLDTRITTLSRDRMAEVFDAIRFVFAMPR
jgi:mRNA interferase MazF